MNIVVLTNSGRVVTRPETTRKRQDSDIYVPEFVSSVSASKTLFVKIDRPGKCIAEKFAGRYFSSWCEGLLLYADDLNDGSAEGFASSSCLDSFSIIPFNCMESSLLDEVQLTLAKKAISECSRYCFLRTGDFIGIELEDRKFLCRRSDSVFEAGYDNNKFNIIF